MYSKLYNAIILYNDKMNQDKTILFLKKGEYITINYYDIKSIEDKIPSTKIHINELSKYNKLLTNMGYECYYISDRSKL